MAKLALNLKKVSRVGDMERWPGCRVVTNKSPAAFERLENVRGVKTIRSDVGTARSLEFNASRIIEAIESARSLNVPYGLIGYSQGCANILAAESLLYSGKSAAAV